MRKFLLISTLLLIVVTSVQLWATQNRTDQKKELDQSAAAIETQIGGPFMLVDQTGKTVSDGDFRGRIMLVFFGFTRCPDECPATVSMFSNMMGKLGDKGNQVAPLFISVDPQNDTPAALKGFLGNFDKRIVGLTGTPEQVKQVTDGYKVYAAKNAESIDHSGYIYIMGKDGKFLKVLPYSVTDKELADAIQPYLSE